MHVEENDCRGSMASEWENSSSRLRIVQSIKIVYIWSERMESSGWISRSKSWFKWHWNDRICKSILCVEKGLRVVNYINKSL